MKRWSGLTCCEITIQLITELRDERSKISNHTANKELRYLRSLFNLGMKKGYITDNPANRVDMMRVEKNTVYVPPQEDIEKVFAVASPEQRDYLWCIRDTLARSREINNLTWEDVDFEGRNVTLFTREKRHGIKTSRIIPMTSTLCEVLIGRYQNRDPQVPWVYWHSYFSRKEGKTICGPYKDRKKFMKSLCQKAGVRYFRFYPLRHSGQVSWIA